MALCGLICHHEIMLTIAYLTSYKLTTALEEFVLSTNCWLVHCYQIWWVQTTGRTHAMAIVWRGYTVQSRYFILFICCLHWHGCVKTN